MARKLFHYRQKHDCEATKEATVEAVRNMEGNWNEQDLYGKTRRDRAQVVYS